MVKTGLTVVYSITETLSFKLPGTRALGITYTLYRSRHDACGPWLSADLSLCTFSSTRLPNEITSIYNHDLYLGGRAHYTLF